MGFNSRSSFLLYLYPPSRGSRTFWCILSFSCCPFLLSVLGEVGLALWTVSFNLPHLLPSWWVWPVGSPSRRLEEELGYFSFPFSLCYRMRFWWWLLSPCAFSKASQISKGHLYSFSRTAVMNCHKLGDLQQHKFLGSQGQKPTIKVWTVPSSFQRFYRRILLYASQLLLASAIPLLLATSLQSQPSTLQDLVSFLLSFKTTS